MREDEPTGRAPERYEYEAARAKAFQEYASFFPPPDAEGNAGRRRFEMPLILEELLDLLPFLLLVFLFYLLFAIIKIHL